MEGWIKIHRKILENPIVCKDSEHYAVWNYLLLNATQKQIDVIFQGKRITLNPGQLITGRKVIAKQFNIDENKVQRILKMFEKQHQIEQQMSSQNRLITIQNWEQYQVERHQNEQQVNSNCTASEQQVNTNKNVKNDKNVKNVINNIPASEVETSPADSVKANSKHKYGEYQNVLLKDEELQTLKGKYENWEELIKYLDEYIEMKGYKAKSHYLAITKWVIKAVEKEHKEDKQKETSEWRNKENEEWRKEWLKQDG